MMMMSRRSQPASKETTTRLCGQSCFGLSPHRVRHYVSKQLLRVLWQRTRPTSHKRSHSAIWCLDGAAHQHLRSVGVLRAIERCASDTTGTPVRNGFVLAPTGPTKCKRAWHARHPNRLAVLPNWLQLACAKYRRLLRTRRADAR